MKLQYRIVMKRIAAALLVTVLCMTGVPFTHVAANQLPQEGMQPADEQALYGYEDYCAGISEQSFLQSPINITCDNITATDNGMLDIQEFDNKAAVVIGKDTEWCEWTFEVPDDGIYNISLEYFPLEGTGLNITAGLYLDNEIPFAELRTFDLPRIWKDKTEIKQDEQGNDLRPTQIEKVRWIDTKLCDTSGKFENPYLFYSKAGSHTLKLRVTRESPRRDPEL